MVEIRCYAIVVQYCCRYREVYEEPHTFDSFKAIVAEAERGMGIFGSADARC